MKNIKLTILNNFSKFKMYIYLMFNSNNNIIINDKATCRLKQSERIIVDIGYALNILAPVLDKTTKVITVSYHKNKVKKYQNILRYTLPIDKTKSYNLDLSYFNLIDPLKTNNDYSLSVFYTKSKISLQIYHSNIKNCHVDNYFNFGSSKVLNDHKILGFAIPSEFKLPEPICYGCKFLSNNSYIKCAVNPGTDTKSCFNCRDFEQKNSTLEV